MHMHQGALRLFGALTIAFSSFTNAANQRNTVPLFQNLSHEGNDRNISPLQGDDDVIGVAGLIWPILKNNTIIATSIDENKLKPKDWPKRGGEPASSENELFESNTETHHEDTVHGEMSEEVEGEEMIQDVEPVAEGIPEPGMIQDVEPVAEEVPGPDMIQDVEPVAEDTPGSGMIQDVEPVAEDIPGSGFSAVTVSEIYEPPSTTTNIELDNEVPASSQALPESSATGGSENTQPEAYEETEPEPFAEENTNADKQQAPVESETEAPKVEEPPAAQESQLASPEWTAQPTDNLRQDGKYNDEYWKDTYESSTTEAIASTKVTDAPSLTDAPQLPSETATVSRHREVLEASDKGTDGSDDTTEEEEEDDDDTVDSPPVYSSHPPLHTPVPPAINPSLDPHLTPPSQLDANEQPEQLQAEEPPTADDLSLPPPPPPVPIIEPWTPPVEPHMIPANQPILSTPLPLPPPYTPHPPMPEKLYKSIAYFCNWAIYDRKHFPENMPLDSITHILYAFANVNPDTGEVTLTDPWADTQCRLSTLPKNPNGTPAPASLSGGCFGEFYRLKQRYRHLRILLSVGGWSFSSNFARGVDTNDKRAVFAKSVVELVNSLALDGVDLDWEYALDPVQADHYVDVCRRTRAELDALAARLNIPPQSFDLSVAAPGGPEQFRHLNIAAMDPYLSFWNLMTYDFAGSWSSVAAYHSNLYNGELSAHRTVDAYIQGGVRPDKLVLGFPIYGRAFTNTRGIGHPYSGVGKGTWESGVYDYKLLPIAGSHEYVDTQSWSAWCYHEPTQTLITYDNAATVKAKADYIKHMNLAGAMFWESSADYPIHDPRSIIGTLTNELRLIEKPANLALEKYIARNETEAAQAAPP